MVFGPPSIELYLLLFCRILKQSGIYVGGKDNATETHPVDSLPVDEWEISPEQIVMDKQLGSDNFGEVFLGKLIGSIASRGVGPYSTSRCAAVKLLRSELE